MCNKVQAFSLSEKDLNEVSDVDNLKNIQSPLSTVNLDIANNTI
jgi:hypothetical protein